MINQLTFTRFFAAFLIVFYHMGGDLFKDISPIFEIIRHNLNLGVGYFFVLSGFVMMIAYGKQDKIGLRGFMINRLARIYPTHILALVCTLLVSLFVSINYLDYFEFDWKGFLLQFFLIQTWFPAYSLSWNVPSWSISVELFFYVAFVFLFNYFFKKMKFVYISFLIAVFWLLSQILMNVYYLDQNYPGTGSIQWYFLYFNPLTNFSSFLVGCLGGYIYPFYKNKHKNYDILIIIVISITILFVLLGGKLLLHNGLLSINFIVIILLLTLNTGHITKIFNNKYFIYLGEISFSFYIFQNPVFILLRKINRITKIENEYLFFCIGVISLLLISHIIYRYFENPLRKILKNEFRK